MTQLDKLTFVTQIFWLTVILVILYFSLLLWVIPQVGRTLKLRKKLVEGYNDQGLVDNQTAEYFLYLYNNHINNTLTISQNFMKENLDIKKMLIEEAVKYDNSTIFEPASQIISKRPLPDLTSPLGVKRPKVQSFISIKKYFYKELYGLYLKNNMIRHFLFAAVPVEGELSCEPTSTGLFSTPSLVLGLLIIMIVLLFSNKVIIDFLRKEAENASPENEDFIYDYLGNRIGSFSGGVPHLYTLFPRIYKKLDVNLFGPNWSGIVGPLEYQLLWDRRIYPVSYETFWGVVTGTTVSVIIIAVVIVWYFGLTEFLRKPPTDGDEGPPLIRKKRHDRGLPCNCNREECRPGWKAYIEGN